MEVVLPTKYGASMDGSVIWSAFPFYFSMWNGILRASSWNIRFHAGVRGRILVWLDISEGDAPLPTQFLDLFNCAWGQRAAVEDYLGRVGGEAIWGPIFRRNLTEVLRWPSLGMSTFHSMEQMEEFRRP